MLRFLKCGNRKRSNTNDASRTVLTEVGKNRSGLGRSQFFPEDSQGKRIHKLKLTERSEH